MFCKLKAKGIDKGLLLEEEITKYFYMSFLLLQVLSLILL